MEHDLREIMESNDDEKREERAVRVWVNSLGIGKYVENLMEEIREGTLLLEVMDKIQPGLVNWKKVNMNPNGIYKKIENCNYLLELGKGLDFSLVSIDGKDIVDGNRKLSLGKSRFQLPLIFFFLRIHLSNDAVSLSEPTQEFEIWREGSPRN